MENTLSHRIQGLFIWFLLTLFCIYAFSLNTAAAVFSNSIEITFHTTHLATTLATGSFILGYALMQLPVGYFLDRFNPRWIVGMGIFLLALGNLLTSLSTHLAFYTLWNFLQGVGASFSFLSLTILMAQWFSKKAFPILIGFSETLIFIFAGILHYVLSTLLSNFSWVQVYKELALFGLILLFISLFFIRSPSHHEKSSSLSLKESFHTLRENPQILLCCVLGAISLGVFLAYADFWYIQIKSFFQVPREDMKLIGIFIFCGFGIGAPFLSWISNKVKSRIKVIHTSLCAGAMALLLNLYLPHFNIETFAILKTTSFFVGFFLSGTMLFYTIMNEISEFQTRGVAMSLLNTGVFLFNVMMLFIPYLFFNSSTSGFHNYLWTLPFCVLLSILFLPALKESYFNCEESPSKEK